MEDRGTELPIRVHLYLLWPAEIQELRAAQPDDTELEDEAGPSPTTTLEEAEEAAWTEIQAHLQQMNPFDFQDLVAALLEGIDAPTVVAVAYDKQKAVTALLSDLKDADLGLSVNVAGLTDIGEACCRQAGITRHSVEYSLSFRGELHLLLDRQVLEIATMCGHGMVSFGLVQKMVQHVKEGRQRPQRAARFMAKFCTCGVFNPVRAERLLRKAAVGD